MAGIMFVIRVPTEAEERRLSADDEDMTPKLVLKEANGGVAIVVTPARRQNVDERADNSLLSPKSRMPQGTINCGYNRDNAYTPLPKSASITSSKRQTESKEVLVEIEIPPPTEGHDNKGISNSIDDFRVGMMATPKPLLKRTRSHNSLVRDGSDDEITRHPSSNSNKLVSDGTMHKSWEGYLKDLVTSAKKTKPVKEPELNIEYTAAMETVVRAILKKMNIRCALWQTSDDKNYVQISLTVEAGYAQDHLLNRLAEWGIGERKGSSISMVPCTLFAHKPQVEYDYGSAVMEDQDLYNKNSGAWDRFMNSIQARLKVGQIVDCVKQDASITFDFLSLLVVAAILAAFGLVEDSTILLVSSMLVSPLMGPIIAATFGTVIKDPRLTKFGIINELIGIACTIVVGFVIGLIFFNVNENYTDDALTEEMKSRCEIHSLIVGIFIAIPSGAAVALSILGENIGSLVGVAISASLLPPAVNTGLVWALATMYLCHQGDESKYNIVVHSEVWSKHQAVELIAMGSISLALTISNVICVYAAGYLFLKIKEVAPIVSRDQRRFWKHDVKLARDFNNKSAAASVGDNASMNQRWAEEFAEFKNVSDADRIGLNAEMLQNIGHPAYQQTWSPMTYRHRLSETIAPLNEMESVYLNMSHPLNQNSHFRRHYTMGGPGSSKTVMYRSPSPSRYRSLINDRIFAARRTSMPHYIAPTAAPKFKNRSDENRLGNIQEVSSIQSVADARPKEKTTKNSSGRKFTVTPAADDSLKK